MPFAHLSIFIATCNYQPLLIGAGFASGFGFVGSGNTFPLIVSLLLAVLAFDEIVTVFVNLPSLLVAYLTDITPDSPGIIGSLGQVGTVQPHDPLALEIINGSLPVLVNTNSLTPLALCSIVP